MTPVLIGQHTAGSIEWLAEREYRIGGSEIAAVLGLSPWQSPFSLFAAKKGMLPEREDTPELEWGRRHERTVWERLSEEYASRYAPGLYAHSERSWQVASPDAIRYFTDRDRFAETEGVIEIKTAQRGEKWGPSRTQEVPVYYRTQMLWTMDVMGAQEGILAALIGLSDYRTYRFTWDDAARADLAYMLEAGEGFVQRLRDNDWPDPTDGSAATYEALRDLHPEISEGESVELSSDLAARFILSKAELIAAEKAYTAARSEIAAEMQHAQHAWSDGLHIATRYAKTTKDGEPGRPYVEADRRQTNRRYQTIIQALEDQ